MNKRKIIFLAVAVISLVQIILVLLVDCTVLAWLSKLSKNIIDLGENVGPIKEAVLLIHSFGARVGDEDAAVLGWTIGHMVIHVEWLVSTCILLIFAFKPEPRRSYQVMQFALSIVIVCMCDAGAGIHTGVIIAQNNPTEGARLFFPLFFSKVGLIWAVNACTAVLMLNILMKIHKARREAESRQNLAKAVAVAERQDKVGSYWMEDIIQQPPVLPRVRNVTDDSPRLAVEQTPSTAAYNHDFVPTHVTSEIGSVDGAFEDYTQWGSGPSSPRSQSQHAYH